MSLRARLGLMTAGVARVADVLSVRAARHAQIEAAVAAGLPLLWCPRCRSVLADAELRPVELTVPIYSVLFAQVGRKRIVVSTTRPEMFAACVALCTHPRDERHIDMLGTTVRVPLFGHNVPVWPHVGVDLMRDEGVTLVSTFGSEDDIRVWRDERMATRMVFGADGDLNALAGVFAGLSAAEARRAVVAALSEHGLILGKRPGVRRAMLHARCETEAEYVMAE